MPVQFLGFALLGLGVAIGIVLYWLSRRLAARVDAARQWTEVPAVIETARLAKIGQTSWAPAITYSYSVAGKSYTGKRLQFGGLNMTRQDAETVLAAYPVGQATTVRYDPQRHDFAVLRLQGDTKGLVIAAVALAAIFSFTGLLIIIAG